MYNVVLVNYADLSIEHWCANVTSPGYNRGRKRKIRHTLRVDNDTPDSFVPIALHRAWQRVSEAIFGFVFHRGDIGTSAKVAGHHFRRLEVQRQLMVDCVCV